MTYKTSRCDKNNWNDLKERVVTSLEALINNGNLDKATVEVMLSLIKTAVIKEKGYYERERCKDN